MNEQQVQIVNQLKQQGILPQKVYFQYEVIPALNNKYSFPNENLYSLVSDLETPPPDMYNVAIQSIAEVKLNENYQYTDVLQRSRNIIEIIYPTDSFQSLDDGVYFYTLDEHKQLQIGRAHV